jgi:hypothetical protein
MKIFCFLSPLGKRVMHQKAHPCSCMTIYCSVTIPSSFRDVESIRDEDDNDDEDNTIMPNTFELFTYFYKAISVVLK